MFFWWLCLGWRVTTRWVCLHGIAEFYIQVGNHSISMHTGKY